MKKEDLRKINTNKNPRFGIELDYGCESYFELINQIEFKITHTELNQKEIEFL